MGSNYSRGRIKEWEVMKTLGAAGYRCVRSAGSHGPWDVCAVGPMDTILVQVKLSKTGYVAPSEVSDFKEMPTSKWTRKEVWVFTKHKRYPEVIIA